MKTVKIEFWYGFSLGCAKIEVKKITLLFFIVAFWLKGC